MASSERPIVGVAVVVEKDGNVLVGRDLRKGHVFGVPGGHWENHETLKECALREVFEESGIECSHPKLISVYDFYREDKQKRYVTIGMKATYVAGELRDLATEGRFAWAWKPVREALALKLFPPDVILLERYLSGVVFE
jgi:8-oxo-dGTP diphosphatase